MVEGAERGRLPPPSKDPGLPLRVGACPPSSSPSLPSSQSNKTTHWNKKVIYKSLTVAKKGACIGDLRSAFLAYSERHTFLTYFWRHTENPQRHTTRFSGPPLECGGMIDFWMILTSILSCSKRHTIISLAPRLTLSTTSKSRNVLKPSACLYCFLLPCNLFNKCFDNIFNCAIDCY